MSILDWLILTLPIVAVLGIAYYTRHYVRGVVDFVAAGRCAGRYVMTIGDMASVLSVISVVALVEVKYRNGFGVAFWEMLLFPVGIIMGLTGYCVYRFRQTRALSNGQFLEMRYNRSFRIVGSFLRIVCELICNAVGPAIAANFFIYFLDLPHKITIWGHTFPTFAIVVGIVIVLALAVILPGGRVALLVTDCLQGLCCYPVFVAIVLFVLIKFSWHQEIAPVMLDRLPNESFLNPFDLKEMRDFNLFSVMVMVISGIMSHAIWSGNDNTNAGRTPHEQKMAGVIGAWRGIIRDLMVILLALTIITVMTHAKFSGFAAGIRTYLSDRVADEVIEDSDRRAELSLAIHAVTPQEHRIGIDTPYSQENTPDTPYMEAAHNYLGNTPEANYTFQRFRTLYYQMMMPIAIRELLPAGLLGFFALMMTMLMLTTDDSRIFNSGAAIVQDLIVPMKKKPFTPKGQLLALRLSSLGVAIFFFIFSICFVNLDYIQMFLVIAGSIWAGGAGPVFIFGLYSRFGNVWGAWAALIFGSGLSVVGVIIQRNWSDVVYPFLERHGWVESVGSFLEKASAPFHPYISWTMDPVKCPINSYEIVFLTTLTGILAYVIGSLVTRKEPFNLDKMLHRGQYAIKGEETPPPEKWSVRRVLRSLVGITSEYTRSDKILAWGVFFYAIVYQFGICFLAVVVWNRISPWPNSWWSAYFQWTYLIIAAVLGTITAVWFCWGGIRDGLRLFKDLATRIDDPNDDGRVEDKQTQPPKKQSTQLQ